MLYVVKKVAQIAAGVAVGCLASDAVEHGIAKPIGKVIQAKKALKKAKKEESK